MEEGGYWLVAVVNGFLAAVSDTQTSATTISSLSPLSLSPLPIYYNHTYSRALYSQQFSISLFKILFCGVFCWTDFLGQDPLRINTI